MRLSLPDARLDWQPAWLAAAEAESLFSELADRLPWDIHRIRMFGRLVDSPRLSCWMGDADAVYRYSGTTFLPSPWLPVLMQLRARLEEETGVAFNSVLANRYRDGADYMGWHSDDEPELGDRPMIASVSLGATRRFVFKHRLEAENRLGLDLPSGSLLLMAGETQRHYRHALPRTAKPVGERINLTFRRIFPSRR